jgi:hypothetical protein
LTAKLFRTRRSHRRIRLFGSWCGCPAALLNESALVPRSSLLEFDQLFRGAGLMLEILYADRRQRDNDRGFSPLIGHLFGSAAKRPSEPAKAQDHDCYRTGHRTPCRRLAPWMSLHLFHRKFRRNSLLQWQIARKNVTYSANKYIATLGNYSGERLPRSVQAGAVANGRARVWQPVNLPGALGRYWPERSFCPISINRCSAYAYRRSRGIFCSAAPKNCPPGSPPWFRSITATNGAPNRCSIGRLHGSALSPPATGRRR